MWGGQRSEAAALGSAPREESTEIAGQRASPGAAQGGACQTNVTELRGENVVEQSAQNTTSLHEQLIQLRLRHLVFPRSLAERPPNKQHCSSWTPGRLLHHHHLRGATDRVNRSSYTSSVDSLRRPSPQWPRWWPTLTRLAPTISHTLPR